MGAIHFESSINNEKLNKGFKESEKTVEDFVKKVEKSGGVVEDFANLSAKKIKESIAVQKNAIRELQQQIKELENVTKSGSGTYAQNLQAQGQLAAAKRNLSGEEATLIAMQKQQVAVSNKQVVANNAESESQVPIIAGLWKWALGLATVTAAMKIGKSIIESTEASAQLFEEAIAASTTSVNYFFKAIASGDWTNFWEGMKTAARGAVELTKELEKIERRTIEQEVKGAQAQKDIAELRAGTFDKGVENNAKLIENTTKIIEIQKKDYANQASIAKDKYEKTRNQMALENKMSSDKVETLTFEFTKNEQLLELGKKYAEIQDKIGTGQKTEYFKKSRPEKYAELQVEMSKIDSELLNSFKITGDEAGKLATQFEKPTLKALKGLADLKKAQTELEGLAQIGSRRDENSLAAAKNKRETEEKAAAKKAKEDAELENRIKATQEAMKGASGQKLKDLAAGLVLLEKELVLRTEIVRQANMSAWTDQFKGQSMAPMTSIGTKPISKVGALKVTDGVLMELTAIDKKSRETFTKVKTENKELFKYATDLAKKADEDQKVLDKEKKERQEKYYQEGLKFLDSMIQKYGEELGMTEEQAGLISSLAKGDYFAAAFNAFGIVSDMFKESKDNISDFYTNLNDQTKQLIESIDLVNESLSNVGAGSSLRSFNLLSAELVKLKNDAARLNDQLIITDDSTSGRRGGGAGGRTTTPAPKGGSGGRPEIILDLAKQTAELYAEIEELTIKLLNPNLAEDQRTAIIAILNSYNDILNSIEQSVQDITGTTIQDLSRSLTDAFLSGEDAALKWGQTVNDIIKNVIAKQLTSELLTKPITAAINTLIGDTSEGLTPTEAQKFKDTIDALYTSVAPAYKAAIDALDKVGIDFSGTSTDKSSSLTGQIKGVSEDTASMIAGRLMAVNNDMKKGLEIGYDSLELMGKSMDIMSTGVGHLMRIEKNTFDTVQRLDTVISNQVKFG